MRVLASCSLKLDSDPVYCNVVKYKKVISLKILKIIKINIRKKEIFFY